MEGYWVRAKDGLPRRLGSVEDNTARVFDEGHEELDLLFCVGCGEPRDL